MFTLLRSKTVWGGVVAVVTGVGLLIAGEIPNGINAIYTGLLAIFIRDGIRKISP